MPTETSIAARDENGNELLYHRATLPSVQVVEVYERHCPGAAQTILGMAVKEQETENELRLSDNRLEFVTRVMGMVFAFILALCIIGGGIFLICVSHQVTGCITLFAGLIGVIGCLATGGKNSPAK